jgi:hypothetical protein
LTSLGTLSHSKIFVVAISDAIGATSDMAEMQHFGEDDVVDGARSSGSELR